MQKNIVLITVLYSFLCSIPCCAQSLEQKISGWYKKANGFIIPHEDKQAIESAGGVPTYGEITFQGVQKLAEIVPMKETDVFYDLGSGVGKMVTQIFFSTPVKKSVGIELSKERTKQAQLVYEQIQKEMPITKERTLAFIEGDILKAPIDDATIVYLASTCFSKEFMENLTKKLAGLKKGLRVITLKPLAKDPRFELIKTIELPMTWSKNSPVYIYQLK